MSDDENQEQELPEGTTEGMNELPPLVIGAPFALSHDCELFDMPLPAGSKACTVVLKCDECAQKFKINLLSAEIKKCPKCMTPFTHVLLVARADDTDIVTAAMAQVMRANGYEMAEQPDEDEDEDDGEQGEDIVDAEGG